MSRPSARFHRFARTAWQVTEVRWALAALALFVVAVALSAAGAPSWLYAAAYAGCYVAGGWDPALSGLRALRERTLDVDLLMVVAALGAAAIGQTFDGGLLIVIFATSGALEALATRRTEDSVRALLTFAPDRATRLTGGSSGTGGTGTTGPAYAEEEVDVAELGVGDLVLVRPGERVGADGEVVEGESEVDQATITGEPLPASKRVGAEVYAGTLNGVGALTVRVTRAAADSVVARIATLVEEAAGTKARTQLFVERVEQRYSVTVVVLTLALFCLPLLFGADLTETLLRAMTFMIVASPCAVVLATMPPLLSAVANAGRHGVLVKSAVVMEQLGTADRFAFDKTGTLTTGRPAVVSIRPLDGRTERALLAYAAGAERPSEHVLGRAVVAAAAERGLEPGTPEGFVALPGRGVRARVDGVVVEVSSPAALAPGTLTAAAAELVESGERAGHTVVIVLLDGVPAGVLALADQLRPDAREAVERLDELADGSPVLLTGDNERSARALAERVGIADVRAGLLPEDKVAAVETMRAEGDRVLVVGDGVNDAPALAAAHIGVAMGRHGSDLALETADAVVVRDELATLPRVVALSRRARRVVWQNLAIAGTVIVVLATWDLVGHLPLPLGVAGHEGSTVLVALNGLRLLRRKEWTRATDAGRRTPAPAPRARTTEPRSTAR